MHVFVQMNSQSIHKMEWSFSIMSFFSFGNRCNDKRKVESPVQRKTISVLILVYFWKYNASLLATFLQKKYMDLNNLITGVMRYVPYNDETTNVINFQCTKDNLLTICVGFYIVHRREYRIFTELCHHQMELECGTWYHHPRRLQCVLSRIMRIVKVAMWRLHCVFGRITRIVKVAMWHFRCHHHLKNNCIWDNLQFCLLFCS